MSSNRASNRSHEFNRHVLFERYLNFGQELTTVPGMLDNLSKLAEEDSRVKLMKGMLRTKPGTYSSSSSYCHCHCYHGTMMTI